MPSTIKLQDATNNSMDALFKTMNTNTAKETVNPTSTVVTEKIPNAAAKPKVSASVSEAGTQTVTTTPEKKQKSRMMTLQKWESALMFHAISAICGRHTSQLTDLQ